MGLGGAAEGGTTVLAMMILGALGLVVVVLALLLRWTTGRWSASAILVVGVLTVAAVLITANHLSPDARERRRAENLRRDVGAALAFDIGAGSLAEGVRQKACSSDEHGWVASGYARPLGEGGAIPVEALDQLAERVEVGLAGMGFTVTRGTTVDRRPTTWWVAGSRGRESVAVEVKDYGSVWVRAESGCLPPLSAR